jgi:glycosyltransferase involved in cell wall biosynthesis
MKVLILTQYFWPETFRINDLAVQLKQRGHEVTVLTGKPNYPGGDYFDGYGFFGQRVEDYEGIPVHRVPLIRRKRGGGLRLALNYLSFALSASLLGPARLKGPFDAIFVFEPSPITVGLPAIVMKQVHGAPILFWVQDLWPENLVATGAVTNSWILDAVGQLVRFIYKRSDLILLQSRAFEDNVKRFTDSTERLRYFPNWAESLYQPLTLEASAPERAQLPPGFRIMFAGNIGAAQDFETLLGAAEALRDQSDIQWIILGDGRKKEWVEAEVARRRLGHCFHLLGRFPMEQMPRFFALADVLLVSLRRDPAFESTIPSKIQSYLACGKPIVACLDGEGARIVEEAGGGVTCPAESVEGLVDAVRRLYRMSPEQRAAMGVQARRYFEREFSSERLITRLEDWMKEVRR